jgi:cyanophycinase-like exopeptidase
MSGPLALVGGDELNPGNEAQDRVLVAAATGGPAYVVATAAARQRPELAVGHACDWFAGLDLDVQELPVYTRTQANSDVVAAQAARGRFFYLLGGDPGLVQNVLHGTRVWRAIVTAWSAGAALAGSSAGAMAMGGWTLIRHRMPGDRERRYRDALGLVPRIAVLPHFETFGHRWVESAERLKPSADIALVGIDERSAAVWVDGSWTAMGPGGVTVIMGGERRRFESGTPVDGLPQPSPV